MSRLVSRILLSIFMFPLASIIYLLIIILAEQLLRGYSYPRDENTMFFVADGLTWLFVAAYWCLLWRTGVNWNSFRVMGGFVAAVAAAIVGAICGFLAASVMGHGDSSFGVFVGGVLAILLWLIATVFLWRESTAERAEQVKSSSKSAVTCPKCGYNLTGLSESRCPECGTKFTLDQLLSLQPNTYKDIE